MFKFSLSCFINLICYSCMFRPFFLFLAFFLFFVFSLPLTPCIPPLLFEKLLLDDCFIHNTNDEIVTLSSQLQMHPHADAFLQ